MYIGYVISVDVYVMYIYIHRWISYEGKPRPRHETCKLKKVIILKKKQVKNSLPKPLQPQPSTTTGKIRAFMSTRQSSTSECGALPWLLYV